MSMEIEVSSDSPMNELLKYRKERFPFGIFLPLGIFLCVASWAAGTPQTVAELPWDLLLSLSLVFQFRLLDDLADRQRDRRDNPQRVLSRTTAPEEFVGWLAVVFVANCAALMWLKPLPRLGVFLCLTLTMFGCYRAARRWPRTFVSNYHIVLLKYPVFVYVLSPTDWGGGLIPLCYAMTAVYLCFCAYEVLHDSRESTPQGIVGMELVGLALVASFMVRELYAFSLPASIVQGLVTIAGTSVLVLLFYWLRAGRRPGSWCYAIFVVGFSWLFTYVALSTRHFI